MTDRHRVSHRGLSARCALLLILCLILAAICCGLAEENGEALPTDLHLPVVEADAGSPTGQKTTWSCVYFGAYPSAEVADSGWNAVDGYALREGDLIRDDGLYQRLEAAAWENNRTEIDGVSYLRVGLDSAPASGGAREQHYRWEYARPWHYFRVMPIRWRVLDIREGRALLLADRMPDCVPFHETAEAVAWQESTLRSWLNGLGAAENRQQRDFAGTGFIDRAFTAEERDAIVPVLCENAPNRDYSTSSGADTPDRIFLLSNAEVFEGAEAGRYGFAGRDDDDPAKRFTSTLYAKCMGAWWSPVEAYAGNSFWFMRTSGYTPQSVTYVCDFGYIYSKGTLVTCGDAGVLPALWIDLDRADITEAGEAVSTDILRGGGEEQPAWPVPEIGDPTVTEDPSAPGGAYTVWNAVAFGSYPQTEILAEAPEGDVLYGADAEVDPDLWSALEADTMDEWGCVTLEGRRYLRLEGRWFRFDPIIWRVLNVSDGTALLMADRCLDCVPYHAEYRDVYWEESGLRGWLNGTADGGAEAVPYGPRSFAETAFTEEEQQAILVSSVPNACNYYFGTACGSGTHDRVFILSEEEVFCSEKAERYGFRPSDAVADPGRRLVPTAYAAARGAWRSTAEKTAGVGFWLLRTNGYTRDNAVYVGEKGYLYNRGIPVTCMDAGIVPAVRIRLGSAPCVRVEDIEGK